jgi:hypothetical protein
MPADRLARGRAGRARVVAALGIALGLTVFLGAAAPAAAAADPVFSEGDCVVYRLADNGPQGAQCAGLDLSGTRFGEGDFRGADLMGTSFVDGDVQGAKFDGANLTGADLSGTRIVGADFTNSSVLPGVVELTADASGTAAVPITPNLPAGLTLDGCSIVGTPVESGQAFPIGTSNLLCSLSTSFEGTATAVMTVTVTASPTASPTVAPLFTPVPTDGAGESGAADGSSSTPNWVMIGGFIGGGVLVALGIAAFVISNRKTRSH